MSTCYAIAPMACAWCDEPIAVGERVVRQAHQRCYMRAYRAGKAHTLPAMRQPGAIPGRPRLAGRTCACGCGRPISRAPRGLAMRCYRRIIVRVDRATLDRMFPRTNRSTP